MSTLNLTSSIKELNLPTRINTALSNADVSLIFQLYQLAARFDRSHPWFKKEHGLGGGLCLIRGIGANSLKLLRAKMKEHGFAELGMDPKEQPVNLFEAELRALLKKHSKPEDKVPDILTILGE